jgi:hypothetical protein
MPKREGVDQEQGVQQIEGTHWRRNRSHAPLGCWGESHGRLGGGVWWPYVVVVSLGSGGA